MVTRRQQNWMIYAGPPVPRRMPPVSFGAAGVEIACSIPMPVRHRQVQSFLLEAIARDALGDPGAADRALERALDLAEPGGLLLAFLLYPALAGQASAAPSAGPQPPLEPLSDTEIRVLRYLPTNLPVPDIANKLYISRNTVRTHISHLYAKLGTHTRAEAVERARALGLLAASPRRP